MFPNFYCIRFVAFVGVLGFFFVHFSIMDVPETKTAAGETTKNVYSVWAIPPEDVTARVKKLMEGLRSEFGGPQFEPHVTVVGAISLTPDDALEKFKSVCAGLKVYNCTVDRVATGTFFYQCVYLLLHPSAEVIATKFSFLDKILILIIFIIWV